MELQRCLPREEDLLLQTLDEEWIGILSLIIGTCQPPITQLRDMTPLF